MDSICRYCKSRHSWDCDDGYVYLKHGCEQFSLDWDTLDDEQNKNIKQLLEIKLLVESSWP